MSIEKKKKKQGKPRFYWKVQKNLIFRHLWRGYLYASNGRLIAMTSVKKKPGKVLEAIQDYNEYVHISLVDVYIDGKRGCKKRIHELT